MRIAMYMPGLRPRSLSWTLYQDLAQAVRDLGHAFEVWTDAIDVSVEEPGTVFLDAASSFGLDSLMAPLLRTRRMLTTARTLAAQLHLARNVDILYSEIVYPYGTAAALARRLARWPGKLVVKPTGEEVLTLPEANYGFGRYLAPAMLTGWTLRQADAIRCISPLVVEAIAGRTDAPRQIIPSAVANATIERARRGPEETRVWRSDCRHRVDAKLDLRGAKLVLALGRLHPFKGLEDLIRAAGALPSIVLVLAGPSLSVRPHGDHADWLGQVAAEVGVASRVRFPGLIPHDEIHELLGAADVVVVPSILESMNKVSVEAAACGTPFVATNTTGISHFLLRDGVGHLVPPRDPTALAGAISDILDGRRPFRHDAALEFVAQFAPATVAPQFLELCAEALE